MTTPATPYTDSDVQMVGEAIYSADPPIRDGYVHGEDLRDAEARAALDALAAASRLLPAEGTKKTEHEIDWRHRDRELDNPTMTYQEFTEHQIDHEIAAADHLGYEPREVRRRTITTWPDGASFTSAWETR